MAGLWSLSSTLPRGLAGAATTKMSAGGSHSPVASWTRENAVGVLRCLAVARALGRSSEVFLSWFIFFETKSFLGECALFCSIRCFISKIFLVDLFFCTRQQHLIILVIFLAREATHFDLICAPNSPPRNSSDTTRAGKLWTSKFVERKPSLHETVTMDDTRSTPVVFDTLVWNVFAGCRDSENPVHQSGAWTAFCHEWMRTVSSFC